MKTIENWYDDSKFWETFSPAMFNKERWKVVPQEVDHILKFLKLSPGNRILDLCCGPGRHSLELARRRFKVTGVDKTMVYLKKAKSLARKENLDIEFIHADMRKFHRTTFFDGAINLYTAFGYFKNPKDDKRVLANVYRSLKPGGLFMIDLMGKEVLASKFMPRNWDALDDGTIHLQERKLTQNWSWIENHWIYIKGNKRKDFYLAHRLYSAMELSQLLKESGFSKVDIYGDFNGHEYDHQAKRLIAVALKE